jgi:hypothetical protein
MSQTLPQVAHEHHERLLVHVDQIPATADLLLGTDHEAAAAAVREMRQFLEGTLVPHVDRVRAAGGPGR